VATFRLSFLTFSNNHRNSAKAFVKSACDVQADVTIFSTKSLEVEIYHWYVITQVSSIISEKRLPVWAFASHNLAACVCMVYVSIDCASVTQPHIQNPGTTAEILFSILYAHQATPDTVHHNHHLIAITSGFLGSHNPINVFTLSCQSQNQMCACLRFDFVKR